MPRIIWCKSVIYSDPETWNGAQHNPVNGVYSKPEGEYTIVLKGANICGSWITSEKAFVIQFNWFIEVYIMTLQIGWNGHVRLFSLFCSFHCQRSFRNRKFSSVVTVNSLMFAGICVCIFETKSCLPGVKERKSLCTRDLSFLLLVTSPPLDCIMS